VEKLQARTASSRKFQDFGFESLMTMPSQRTIGQSAKLQTEITGSENLANSYTKSRKKGVHACENKN